MGWTETWHEAINKWSPALVLLWVCTGEFEEPERRVGVRTENKERSLFSLKGK